MHIRLTYALRRLELLLTPVRQVAQRYVTRTVVLVASLLIVGFVFLRLFEAQNDATNPNIIRNRLATAGSILEIPNWTITHALDCENPDTPRANCRKLNSKNYPLSLPGEKQIGKLVQHWQGFLRVVLQHQFTKEEIRRIPDKSELVLVIPRAIHDWTEVSTGTYKQRAIGRGLSLTFTIPVAEMVRAGKLEMEIEFGNYNFFGPSGNLPPALVRDSDVNAYATLPDRQIMSSQVMMQLDVSVRLLLAGTALLLDHSNTFFTLALYGTVRALRAWITTFPQSDLRNLAFFIMTGLVCASLLIFLLEISRFHHLRRRLTKPLVGIGVGYGIVAFVMGTSPIRGDLLPDAIASLIGVGIILISFLRHAQAHRGGRKGKRRMSAEDMRNARVGILRDAVLGVALLLNAWGNFSDYSSLAKDEYKNILDWRQSLLVPALIIAAMMEVGSVVKLIDRFTRQAKQRALLERDVEIATDVQKLILPPMTGQFSGGKWKALHFPTGPLAGDWFDCQEVALSNGRKLLAFCLVDVMGRGIGASLLVSAISATWRTWCDDFANDTLNIDDERQERGLQEVANRIHRALQSLKTLKGCTGLFGLLDPSSLKVRYVSIGHPTPIIIDQHAVEGLPNTEKAYLGVWDAPTTRVLSRTLQPGTMILLFSDGVVPRGTATADWILDIEEKYSTRPLDAPNEIVRQVHTNRAQYKSDPTVADDMTLVMLYLSRQNSPDPTFAS